MPARGVGWYACADGMRVLHERCCGLDIHKQFVVACLLTASPDGTVHKEVRTYSAMTNALLALADWLRAEECGPVVMESTGAYWRPVFNLVEEQGEVLVVNAYHVKAVPKRLRGARPMSRTPNGWRIYCAMGCCAPASFRRRRRVTCATSRAIVSPWSTSGHGSPTGCRPCSRTLTSSWPRSSPMCADSRRGRFCSDCSTVRRMDGWTGAG